MRESTIAARIDSQTKKNVEDILQKLGLSHSSAINLFYNQILLTDGLPFDVKMPALERKSLPNMIANESPPEYNAGKNNPVIDVFTMIKTAKKRHALLGFRILGIFGSYARDEAGSSSDLDILYELTSEFRKNFKGIKAIFEINRINRELEMVFGLSIDLVDRSSIKEKSEKLIMDEVLYV